MPEHAAIRRKAGETFRADRAPDSPRRSAFGSAWKLTTDTITVSDGTRILYKGSGPG